MILYFFPQSLCSSHFLFAVQNNVSCIFCRFGLLDIIFYIVYVMEKFSFTFDYGRQFCRVYYFKLLSWSFKIQNALLQALQAFKVSIEKSVVILMGFPLRVTCDFSLVAFITLSQFYIFGFGLTVRIYLSWRVPDKRYCAIVQLKEMMLKAVLPS